MTEGIVLLIGGILLIYIVRSSRSAHQKINELSVKKRKELEREVNFRYRKAWVLGSSFTHAPSWCVALVLLVFALAIIGGVRAIT